ncbi:MAG TPA: hypothetical protein VK701_03780, partial [Solirubrobacteraceae bacterium]|nr:hypothetical protein [Solirubrobacteraceae bacterium]
MLLARERQHLFVELRATPRRPHRRLRQLSEALVGQAHIEEFEVAENGRQQVVEVVRYAGSKLPNHFQFLRLAKCCLGVFTLLRLGALALDRLGQLACALGDAPLQVLLEITQCRLGALLLGDVAGDLRGADDPSRGVADRRDRHRDVDLAPVLASPHRLEVVNPLAPPNTVQNHVLFVQSLGRKEKGYWAAD